MQGSIGSTISRRGWTRSIRPGTLLRAAQAPAPLFTEQGPPPQGRRADRAATRVFAAGPLHSGERASVSGILLRPYSPGHTTPCVSARSFRPAAVQPQPLFRSCAHPAFEHRIDLLIDEMAAEREGRAAARQELINGGSVDHLDPVRGRVADPPEVRIFGHGAPKIFPLAAQDGRVRAAAFSGTARPRLRSTRREMSSRRPRRRPIRPPSREAQSTGSAAKRVTSSSTASTR